MKQLSNDATPFHKGFIMLRWGHKVGFSQTNLMLLSPFP